MNAFQAHDGLSIAARFGQGDPRVVFAHATGFCKETWDPVIDLLDGPGILAIDQRGHGDSGVADPPFDWWDLGRDVVTGMEAVGWEHRDRCRALLGCRVAGHRRVDSGRGPSMRWC